MIIGIAKKIISFLIAVASLLPSLYGSKDMADSWLGNEFPIISASEKQNDTVRVCSFNIRCGDVNGVPVKDRIDIVVKQIKEISPDSFGVQEATPEWMRKLSRKLPKYDWVGISRDNGKKMPISAEGEYSAVFYLKSEYKLKDSGTFWLSDTPDEPSYGEGAACRRVCTWAVLMNKKTKQEYVHVNSHYDHVSEAARVFAANMVTDFINKNFADRHVVFTADMNTTPDGEAYAKMTENLSDARFTAKNSKPFGTFHACNPASHADYFIDFILCSGNIEVEEYRTVTRGVDFRFVSDHFPIYADIKLL